MVTIKRVSKLEKTVVQELEELGGKDILTDHHWDTFNGDYTCIEKRIEVYFDEEDYDAELEMGLDEIVENTAWEVDLQYDWENYGVLIHRDDRY